MAEFDALKAKIPGEDTGIQIKNTICAICSPAPHCGLTCYVKDDKVIKVEGWKEHPDSNGGICTKGLSNKEFLYREDRILYPMRRVGERGEGKFERITWEEAYKEIAEKLNAFTEKVEASFLLDQLQYMVKGGRCSAAAALGANLLNLKPCIEVKNGKMGVVKKYRGNYAKCLATYIKDRLANRDDLDKGTLFVTRTPVTDECFNAVKDAVAQYNDFETTYWNEAGCTVSCHCGPGTLGVLFVRK